MMNIHSLFRSALGRIITNSALLMIEGVVGRLSNFLFTLFIVRYLSVSDFGFYSSILSFAVVGTAIAEFGVSTVLIREIAQQKGRATEIFSGALILSLPLFVATSIGIVGAAVALGYSRSFVLLLCLSLTGMLGNALLLVTGGVLRAFERMVFLSTINSILLAASALVGITWLILGAQIRELIILFALTPVINASILFIYVIRRFSSFSLSRGIPVFEDLFRQAIPLAVFNVCAIIIMRYDVLLLSKMRGMAETGIFSAARNITDTLSLLVASVTGAVFPFMAARWNESAKQATVSYENMLRFFIIVAVAITGGVFLLSDKVVLLLYQDRYMESSICLKILIWSFLFNALGGPVSMFLIISKDRLKRYVPYALAATLVCMVLNTWMIPLYGYTSASIVAVLVSLLLFIFKMASLGDILPVRPRWARISWRPLVAGSVMGGILYGSRDCSLVLLIAIGFVTYLMTLFILGEFCQDLRTVVAYMRRTDT